MGKGSPMPSPASFHPVYQSRVSADRPTTGSGKNYTCQVSLENLPVFQSLCLSREARAKREGEENSNEKERGVGNKSMNPPLTEPPVDIELAHPKTGLFALWNSIWRLIRNKIKFPCT